MISTRPAPILPQAPGPRHLRRRLKGVNLVLWTALGALALTACEQPVPDPLDEDSVEWTTYTNRTLGFSLDIPASYDIEVDDNSVVLSDDGHTAVRVTHADREEARNRGLWAQVEPREEREYAGRTGQYYVYKHWDGPSYVPTLAWVVRHQGKDLGVEFRTTEVEMNDVHEHMLKSLDLM